MSRMLIAVDTHRMVPYRTTNNRTMQSIRRYRFEGIASNVDSYRMLTTTMQSPRLECLALLIAVDTYRMVPYCTTNNRTTQSIRRYRFERRFVPDAHNDDAVAKRRMSRLECLAFLIAMDMCRMVPYHTTKNRTTLQSKMRSESEILSKFQMQHKNAGNYTKIQTNAIQ